MALGPARRLGALAEKAFEYELLERGFGYALPHDTNSAYDIIVISGDKLVRVQIKSTHGKFTSNGGECYKINTSRHIHAKEKIRTYIAGEFDILAATVMPLHLWYIIPAERIVGKHLTIQLFAGIKDKGYKGKTRIFEDCLNRWRLLQ